jgi:formylglycine-generating enzyme required for sulfatase activity
LDDDLSTVAWFEANAEDQAQAVAGKQPNALGFYDMLGNVVEWVTGVDGEPATKGGSFLDEPGDVQIDARARQTRKWNETDPQIPKSKWWLSDGPFVGFRIVREP